MNRSQVKWLLVSIGFSVLVLGVVLYFTVDDTTVDYIRRINPFYLLAAVVLHLLSLVFWSLRIQKMSGSLGFRVRFTHCMNLVLANMLVAAVTPSQAGGEPVRIHELYRAGVPVGDATAVVIMERVLDGIVLGALGLFCVFFLGKYWRSLTTGFSGMGVLIGVACAVTTLIVIFFVYSVRNPDCLKRALRWGSRWVDRRWHLKRLEHLLEAIDREVDNFNQALTRFIGHGKGGLFWGLVFSLLFWLSEFVIASFLLMGLGQPPHFIESFIVQILVAIIMMIPLTPGSSGIAELSATSFYSLFVPSSIVGIFVLLWRLILYYLNIILGLLPGFVIVRREVIARARKHRR
ncbi:MAG: flippase-like domain-containing protein [Methanoculleus sp.]|nr:flippase-like domain-containing protein [Methanoculleus sp.]